MNGKLDETSVYMCILLDICFVVLNGLPFDRHGSRATSVHPAANNAHVWFAGAFLRLAGLLASAEASRDRRRAARRVSRSRTAARRRRPPLVAWWPFTSSSVDGPKVEVAKGLVVGMKSARSRIDIFQHIVLWEHVVERIHKIIAREFLHAFRLELGDNLNYLPVEERVQILSSQTRETWQNCTKPCYSHHEAE